MLKSAAGINLVHVPYKGSGPAVTDLLGGNVQAAMLVPGNVLPHLKSGKLKVLAEEREWSEARMIRELIELEWLERERQRERKKQIEDEKRRIRP